MLARGTASPKKRWTCFSGFGRGSGLGRGLLQLLPGSSLGLPLGRWWFFFLFTGGFITWLQIDVRIVEALRAAVVLVLWHFKVLFALKIAMLGNFRRITIERQLVVVQIIVHAHVVSHGINVPTGVALKNFPCTKASGEAALHRLVHRLAVGCSIGVAILRLLIGHKHAQTTSQTAASKEPGGIASKDVHIAKPSRLVSSELTVVAVLGSPVGGATVVGTPADGSGTAGATAAGATRPSTKEPAERMHTGDSFHLASKASRKRRRISYRDHVAATF